MTFVSWPSLPCSTQEFAASASCRVPRTGSKCQVEMWPCDAGMSSLLRLSFQPRSSWLCHREDGRDLVTARFRSPFYLSIPRKHAVSFIFPTLTTTFPTQPAPLWALHSIVFAQEHWHWLWNEKTSSQRSFVPMVLYRAGFSGLYLHCTAR